MFGNRTIALSMMLTAAGAAAAGCAAEAGASAGTKGAAIHASANVASAEMSHRTTPFKGVKANTGYATHRTENGRQILAVSDDFVIPDAPAPSWQVVDSQGNTYLLNQFRIKDGKTNRQITLPGYVRDVKKVQVWCTFAEVLLGEAEFASPVH